MGKLGVMPYANYACGTDATLRACRRLDGVEVTVEKGATTLIAVMSVIQARMFGAAVLDLADALPSMSALTDGERRELIEFLGATEVTAGEKIKWIARLEGRGP